MVIEVAGLYLAIGVGCAGVSVWMVSGRTAATRAIDALMLVGLWPLVGPLFLARPQAPIPASDFGHADLASRAEVARGRLAELDRALRRPELDPGRAEARIAELERDGSERALAVARRRADSLQTLVARRNRLAGELEELAELLAQLQTQSEIVRLAGEAAIGAEPVTDLIDDIEARLFGVEQLLQEER